jgi:fatty acid desaturase
MATGWRAAVAPEEVRDLLAIADARAWLSIAVDWGLVAAAFALVAHAPGILTVVVALVVIGGRQLGLAVLMHEAAHRTLLRHRRWNDAVGTWLCAYPIWGDLHAYRAYHLRHHAKTLTEEDPDLGLATPFPITRRSLWRKVWRDLSGQTGLKRAAATLRRERTRRTDFMGMRNRYGVVITNAALLVLLALAGHPALYLLWVGAWLTTYSLAMRIRSIAEHAMIDDPADPLRNTRTTLAAWWERLLIAPNRVNFHLEHHLLPTVPHYRLPYFHRLLRERGVLARACVTRGYLRVLRTAASAG